MRFWMTAWLAIVVSIWIGSVGYGRWETREHGVPVVSATALGGGEGRVWLWRGLFGSILWTGAALAMALATADGDRRRRVGHEPELR